MQTWSVSESWFLRDCDPFGVVSHSNIIPSSSSSLPPPPASLLSPSITSTDQAPSDRFAIILSGGNFLGGEALINKILVL